MISTLKKLVYTRISKKELKTMRIKDTQKFVIKIFGAQKTKGFPDFQAFKFPATGSLRGI